MEENWSFFNDQGRLESKGSYKNGLQDGYFEFFFPDGTLEGKGNFEKGNRIGFWEQFDSKGNSTIRTKYKINYRSK